MKHLWIILTLATATAYGQLTIKSAKDSLSRYRLGSYSYHEQFTEHKGYGAPVILTADGGAAAFGGGDDGATLVKLNNKGKLQWKRVIKPQGDEMETQSVVQDKNGNFYVFTLVYDNTKYRGGCERVVYINKTGVVVWDKLIGSCYLLNNPTVSYIRALNDGRIALRGHVVLTQPEEGKDPKYHYWEGWINDKGVLTQKSGDIIDWANQDWQKLYKPE